MKSVLFLCTGNSARSILAEAYLNHAGRGRFTAYSAGSHPAGQVNPLAMEVLQRHGIEARQPRSKSWDEFARGPAMELIITVCDSAAAEQCPAWPGRPASERWSIPDPAAVQGSATVKRQAFEAAFDDLKRRIDRLLEA